MKKAVSQNRIPGVVVTRPHCFQKWDNPFGFSQHVINIAWIGSVHFLAFQVLFCNLTKPALKYAAFFLFLYGYTGGLGITIGCHRYWTHKTFKATFPLQVLLMIMQTMAAQYPIHKWCLDHRIHHKYTDTNADPHNSKRGFWFSHVGWLLLPKHKDLQEKLMECDMSDLEGNSVVQFQSRWYLVLFIMLASVIPVSVLYYVWKFSLFECLVLDSLKHVIILHISFSINSVAHIWGDKPYERTISSVDNKPLALFALGEGFHNYHHKFPSDYRTSEFGWKCNFSALLIDIFAKMGWAYDLKTVSKDVVRRQLLKNILESDVTQETLTEIKNRLNQYNFQMAANDLSPRDLERDLVRPSANNGSQYLQITAK